MPKYETTFIVRQDVSPNEVEKLAETYVNLITEMGGKVVNKEYWGLRTLAYIIKKSRKGHYVMLGIDAPFEAVKEMQRQMSINENIIREVTLRVEELSSEPSIMMRNTGKDSSDDSNLQKVVEE